MIDKIKTETQTFTMLPAAPGWYLVRLMARISEQSFRRGFQHAEVLKDRRCVDPLKLRFDVSLDIAPYTDSPTGGHTSIERLFMQCGVLHELGFDEPPRSGRFIYVPESADPKRGKGAARSEACSSRKGQGAMTERRLHDWQYLDAEYVECARCHTWSRTRNDGECSVEVPASSAAVRVPVDRVFVQQRLEAERIADAWEKQAKKKAGARRQDPRRQGPQRRDRQIEKARRKGAKAARALRRARRPSKVADWKCTP